MSSDERFNSDGLALSARYAGTMNEIVLPWLAARRDDKTIKGGDGRPLFTSRFDADAPRGTVVIVHGFTENADKFAELIHSLLRNHYSVLAYDQRGHGRSWRPEGIDDLSLTHVDRFDEYVNDLRALCDQRLRDMPKPWMAFAHSMGGAVTARFLEQWDGVFERVALCSPMIAPNTGLPNFVAKGVCQVNVLLGRSRRRVFISKPFSGPEDFDTSCASGRERFDWYDAIRVGTPAFQNNGPTYGWTLESLRIARQLMLPGEVEKIRVPVRVYTAEDDNSVLPQAQELFGARLKDGQRVLVRGARHEIYRSGDAVLFPWWHEVLEYFNGNVKNDGSNG